jgi:AcrR family transcriptional regulator
MEAQSSNRQIILDRAISLFFEKGYDGVGVAEIVQASGITKPTLYYYFGSKEGLLEAALNENYCHLNSSLESASLYVARPENYYEDVYPVLCGTTRAYFDFARDRAAFYLMALSMSFSPELSAPAKLIKPHRALQHDIIRRMFLAMSAAHGNLRGKEDRLARYFTALVNSHIGFWARNMAEFGDKEINDITRQFMHGIFA